MTRKTFVPIGLKLPRLRPKQPVMLGWSLSRLWHCGAVAVAGSALAFLSLLLVMPPAFAQTRNLFAPQATVPGQLTPGTGSPGATLGPGLPPSPSAPAQAQIAPVVPAGHVALAVAARYGRDAPQIAGGLIWRV